MIPSHSFKRICALSSLFIDESKIDSAVSRHLGIGLSDGSQDVQLTIRPYHEIQDGVKEVVELGGKVWVRYK